MHFWIGNENVIEFRWNNTGVPAINIYVASLNIQICIPKFPSTKFEKGNKCL